MLPADDLDAAVVQEMLFQDERVFQYWDGERALGQLISQNLKLVAPIAWDIYLLYPSGALWQEAKIPAPIFWMHQLNERSDLYLDSDRLIAEVQKALEMSGQ